MKEFRPHPLLHNAHAMTLAAALVPRRDLSLPAAQVRLFEIEPGTQMLARCHWQGAPREKPTLVLVHGLEGSSESRYMLTAAGQAFAAGFNVLRVNQRTCGASERLSATLYNSGLGGDYKAILYELIEKDRLPAVCFAGYSMGGNLVFKMAGEFGADPPRELAAICGICPTIDLARCVDAVDAPGLNAMYRWNFVHSLKSRMERKARRFPGRYRLDGMAGVRTVREFDDAITAPHCGYRDAADYYERASAVRLAGKISVPALILTAQDDPFVPVSIFDEAALRGNRRIEVVATQHGGHCGFISREGGNERYWAEARLVDFCKDRASACSETGGA